MIFAGVSWVYVNFYEWSAILVVFSIIWISVILIQICHDWFFVKVDLAYMTDDQRTFRFVMIVEVVVAAANVISAMLFIFINMWKTPVISLSSGSADMRRDFLHGQRVHLSYFMGLMVPFIALVYYYALDQEYMKKDEDIVKTLYLVVAVLLFL